MRNFAVCDARNANAFVVRGDSEDKLQFKIKISAAGNVRCNLLLKTCIFSFVVL